MLWIKSETTFILGNDEDKVPEKEDKEGRSAVSELH